MPKAKTAEEEVSNVDILKALQGLTQVLVERLPQPKEENLTVSADITSTATQPVEEESDPVPFEFRQVVDEVLNKYFEVKIKNGARIAENVDGFYLTIIVPDKYSSLREEAKAVIGGDVRTKAIPYALREIGVKEWADKVWKTFPPDIQGQITEDRLKDEI